MYDKRTHRKKASMRNLKLTIATLLFIFLLHAAAELLYTLVPWLGVVGMLGIAAYLLISAYRSLAGDKDDLSEL